VPELKMPMPPTFTSVEEERQHRKERLAAGFRLFSRFGFDEGVAGHITARDPEREDCFWVNPFGMHFGHIRASDLILVSHEGEVVEGDRAVNGAAFAIHSQVHAARPDAVAALTLLSGRLTESRMRALNRRVEVDGEEVGRVAADALTTLGLVRAPSDPATVATAFNRPSSAATRAM